MNLFRKKYKGVLPDNRLQADKDKDYLHEERLPSALATFQNSKIIESLYPYDNQNSTSSCVAHGVGLGLQIERKTTGLDYVEQSKMFPYRLRSNYSSPGCMPSEMFSIYSNYGSPLYLTLPTPISETAANAVTLTPPMYSEALNYRGKEYWAIKKFNDIDTLAQIAQQGHGIPIWIYADWTEWSVQYPSILKPTLQLKDAPISHEVCILPYSSFIENGVRYLTIQDSSWFGGLTLRYLSEDFISKRVLHAGYWDAVVQPNQIGRPTYTFTKILRVGSSGNEVKMVQQLLVSEGLLASDCMTGYFGGYTLKAVQAFQNKYADDILKPLGLNSPTTTWGSMCIACANRLCK